MLQTARNRSKNTIKHYNTGRYTETAGLEGRGGEEGMKARTLLGRGLAKDALAGERVGGSRLLRNRGEDESKHEECNERTSTTGDSHVDAHWKRR